jgi:hypothetical protein
VRFPYNIPIYSLKRIKRYNRIKVRNGLLRYKRVGPFRIKLFKSILLVFLTRLNSKSPAFRLRENTVSNEAPN